MSNIFKAVQILASNNPTLKMGGSTDRRHSGGNRCHGEGEVPRGRRLLGPGRGRKNPGGARSALHGGAHEAPGVEWRRGWNGAH